MGWGPGNPFSRAISSLVYLVPQFSEGSAHFVHEPRHVACSLFDLLGGRSEAAARRLLLSERLRGRPSRNNGAKSTGTL
jgi:hypothetical protein